MSEKGIAYCYTRVSTKKQKRSLDSQAELLEPLAESEGYVPVVISDIDTGRVAAGSRKGFGSIIGCFKHKQVGALYVARIDRLSRSKEDLINLSKFFLIHNIKLYTPLGEAKLDTKEGQEFFLREAEFAQREAELASLRTKEGLKFARANGRVGGRKLKLTKEEAEQITNIYSQGLLSVREIADMYKVSPPTIYRAMES